MENLSILLVEDEENIAALIKDIFEMYDKKILHAATAEKAKALLKKHPIQFAIMDISLPDMNGIELFKEIAPDYPQLDSRVIFMSGYHPDAKIEGFIQETNNRFIQKPFNLSEFRSMIETFIDA